MLTHPDTSMFQDVTNDINLNVTNGNYQIDFDNLDSVYVVKFDSTYDGDAQSLTLEQHFQDFHHIIKIITHKQAGIMEYYSIKTMLMEKDLIET